MYFKNIIETVISNASIFHGQPNWSVEVVLCCDNLQKVWKVFCSSFTLVLYFKNGLSLDYISKNETNFGL